MKAFCRGLFNRAAFQQNLKRQWDDLTLDTATRTLILHYAFGRPPTSIDVTANFDLASYLARVIAEQSGVAPAEGEDDE